MYSVVKTGVAGLTALALVIFGLRGFQTWNIKIHASGAVACTPTGKITGFSIFGGTYFVRKEYLVGKENGEAVATLSDDSTPDFFHPPEIREDAHPCRLNKRTALQTLSLSSP